MLFNSLFFLVFLVVVVSTYYYLPSRKSKKYFLVFASYIFYGYWDWRFCGLLFLSTIMDYIIGKAIYEEFNLKRKLNLLNLSILLNLGLLGLFKYYNFFIDSFSSISWVKLDFAHINVILPVGVSFYTFQSLSYTFDLYRNKMKPSQSLLDYTLFVSFFPQLVAGPIEKAKDLLPQIERCGKPTMEYIKEGIVLITLGMFRKVLLGDTSGKFVDHIFAEPNYYSSSELIAACFLFSIQIYMDFSGYSLIAKGCGKLLGVDLVVNFKQPYFSRSITDFWRRWHISLSEWLKDYVYIWWLGGNRKGKFRTYINLFITMVLGGLWHGANWTFVVWGMIHGIGLAFDKVTTQKNQETIKYRFIRNVFGIFSVYLFVVFAWLFFRAQNLSDVQIFFSRMFVWQSSELAYMFFGIVLSFMVVAYVLDMIELKSKNQAFLLLLPIGWRYGIITCTWVVLIFFMLANGKPMPFIYFQF